jgi:PQQ-dependent dehydrogenase (s-GDH family)
MNAFIPLLQSSTTGLEADDLEVEMPRFLTMAFLMAALVLVGACTATVPQAPTTPATGSTPEAANTPEVPDTGGAQGAEAFVMREVVTGLEFPWELIYGPDDYLWVTERTGKRVIRVNPADGAVQVALEISEAYQRTTHDGVLGMALHPELLQGTGNDYVYVAYVYQGEGGSGNNVNRRAKIVRYTYDAESETLGDALDLITELPASGDHNSGRLLIGPDEKLYYSLGDQGNNQFGNACFPILAQVLPTAEEIAAQDWTHYQGKVLRLNLDGSIPEDNPEFDGVRSHVFTVGHRNVQGLAMSAAGLLYGTEHGPKSDDEVNLLEAGKNYGWPHVAGYQDDQAYVYANWSEAENCRLLQFSDYEVPASVPLQEESEWSHPDFVPPLFTFGTVPDDYDFHSPECGNQEWICWPTIAPTGVELYTARDGGMAGWGNSLLVTGLKTGTVHRIALSEDGRSTVGEVIPYFKTINRYRDVAIAPDGRTFYVITDSGNWTLGEDGIPTNVLENPGAILEFTFAGEEE